MYPMNCNECPQCRSCQASMYTDGCSYYPYHKTSSIGFVKGIKAFFGKIFR